MAENLSKRPSKGILKNSSSFDVQDRKTEKRKSRGSTKWDEMNIMATLHPPDKDYGHMKIDEPKTPYNFEGLEDVDPDTLDAAELAERIRQGALTQPKVLQESQDDDDEEDEMSAEEKAMRRDFEAKRKKHYNEFYAVKLARKLLEKDEEEDDDDESAAAAAADEPKPSGVAKS